METAVLRLGGRSGRSPRDAGDTDFFMRHVMVFLVGMLACILPQTGFANGSGIPDVFVYAESRPFTAVLVEKATQQLWVYAKDENGALYVRHSFACSTGEASGDKQLSGDRKTPEGVYFFLTEFEERYLAPIYGSGAFPIDYPNFMDLRAGKTGNAIWLHGTNKPLRPQDTNGCVALENHNLDAMRGEIRLLRSPMIVVDRLDFQKESMGLEAEQLQGLVRSWVKNLRGDSYHAYLSLYARDFLPDISWWPDWLKLRLTLENQWKDLAFEIRDLDIFRVENRATAIFDLVARAGSAEKVLGRRLLYMETDASGEALLVGDPWLAPPENPIPSGAPCLAGLGVLGSYLDVDGEITRMVDDWLTAWASQKIEPYAAFYARGFRSQGRDRRAWIRYKEGLNRQYSYIRVDREGPLEIRMRGKDRAEVRFLQKYDSSGFETRGHKRLDLIREGGRWKIYRETWEG